MIDFPIISFDPTESDYWNISKGDDGLFDLLNLMVHVIPIAYVFRCRNCNGHIRLIVIADQHQYQEFEKTKMILNFASIGHANIHIMHLCYGTIIDFLQRGHLFFSANCISTNCIYKRKGLNKWPQDSNLNLDELKARASAIFNLEIDKISNFFIGAETYLKINKLSMVAFMLHQTCEQLYRLVILIFSGKDFKSHLLHILRKEAAYFFPEIYTVFNVKEQKELKWINLLQASYLGARYQGNYCIKFNECVFLMDSLQSVISSVKKDLFLSI